MGQETSCKVEHGNKVSTGKAYLEADNILFRGDFRLSIPTKDIKSVASKAGQLIVKFSGGTAKFALGALADKWAHKILNPRSLVDKLGIKADSTVAVIGVNDPAFLKELNATNMAVVTGRARADTDIIVLAVNTLKDIEKLKTHRKHIKKNGAIWVVIAKGNPSLKATHLIASGKTAGLIDNKVARFSETHTAYRFVIPVNSR
jgi:hypothetical protein